MLNLVCALKCEAQPLIDYYQLRLEPAVGAYDIFYNPDSCIKLILSRPGKLNAAAATACLYHYSGMKTAAWLNVGIAGHRSHAIGRPVLVHKVMDVASEQVWYPQILFNPQIPTSDLKTLDLASTEYEDVLFDMEASGFFNSATRFSCLELIHCLKIISDNAEYPAQKTSGEFFSSLVNDNIGVIDKTIRQLIKLSEELIKLEQPPAFYNNFLKKWHFTIYEQTRLKQLLQRWHVLHPDDDPEHIIGNCRTGKDLIRELESLLDNTIIRF